VLCWVKGDGQGREETGREGGGLWKEQKWEDKPQATYTEKVLERNLINARS